MKRVKIIVKGDVQRVGYRDEVQRIGRKTNVTGYVENFEAYDVKIVAEGEEENLNEFINKIKIQRYPIFVEELEIEWSEPSKEFSYFDIKRGEWQEELAERFDTAGRIPYRLVELGERSVELGERNVSIGEKILRKQDEIIFTIKDESEKTRKELTFLRSDLREYIETNLKEIHSKISKIEKALKKAGIM